MLFDHDKKQFEILNGKLDLILEALASMPHLTPEDRAAITTSTATLKASSDQLNAAVQKDSPAK